MKVQESFHVDNGGLSVSVSDETERVIIEISASYFGYPNVSTSIDISGGGPSSSEILQRIGSMFIVAAEKLKH